METLIFEKSKSGRKGYSLPAMDVPVKSKSDMIPSALLRSKDAMLPEVSENEISRHYIRLSQMNFNIESGLYPLGSCTMKYNPKVNEVTANLPGFVELHPCSNDAQAQGALRMMYELGEWLKEITGLQGVSLQPSAGAQGEMAGILMFRAYHLDRGDTKRKNILIPDSAHGTNPATAAIGGFNIINIKSNEDGSVNLDDLRAHANDETAGMMITCPSTIGIFEGQIVEIEKIIHGAGGLMYMDGANLNALLGIVRSGDMKFDCVHINLHKTFATPHGGGGPGAGPVCVSDKLVPFLPIPQVVKNGEDYAMVVDCPKSIGKMHSYYGNFGVLLRAYTYMRMLGKDGLREVSENAIINANYLMALLKDHYEFPYQVKCMHECVLSADRQKANGVSAKDIAKRLLDYGYHAPTIYFPMIVHESMLIEPTETETIESLNNFADAMIKIAEESKNDPQLVINSPYTTPMKRLNDALAARNLNVKWEN